MYGIFFANFMRTGWTLVQLIVSLDIIIVRARQNIPGQLHCTSLTKLTVPLSFAPRRQNMTLHLSWVVPQGCCQAGVGVAHWVVVLQPTEGNIDCCSAPASAEGCDLERKLHPLTGRIAVPV